MAAQISPHGLQDLNVSFDTFLNAIDSMFSTKCDVFCIY